MSICGRDTPPGIKPPDRAGSFRANKVDLNKSPGPSNSDWRMPMHIIAGESAPGYCVITNEPIADIIKSLIPRCKTPEEVAVLSEAYKKLYDLNHKEK